MKTCLLLLTALTILASGCGRDPVYRTVLTDNERIAEKAPVLVDGVTAGYLKALRIEGGNRIAELVFIDELAERTIKDGVVRVLSNNGSIDLRSANTQRQSPSQSVAAPIPTQSQAEYALRQYATKQTLVVAGIALLVVLILCLICKSLFHVGLIVLCLAVAGLTAWILHPYLIPHIEQLYAAAPDHVQGASPPDSAASPGGNSSRSIERWDSGFVRALEHKPHPRVVAFAAILVLAFIPYAILLGSAVRSLRRKN